MLGIDPEAPDTNAVILNGQALRESDAALAVLSTLPGWSWVCIFGFVPRIARDAIYRLIARNRYKLFGRYETCVIDKTGIADRIVV